VHVQPAWHERKELKSDVEEVLGISVFPPLWPLHQLISSFAVDYRLCVEVLLVPHDAHY